MPALVLLVVLILPVVFACLYRKVWARLGLALVWLPCGGFAVFCFHEASGLRRDLDRVDRYELATSTGDHTVSIPRFSQGSMLGVITGGEGRPSKDELERLKWSFPDKVWAQWFDLPHEELGEGEIALFTSSCAQELDPVLLSYRIVDADKALLKSRVLLVRHDSSARHMLRDHGLSFIELFAWASSIWGAIWLAAQIICEWRRRTVATPKAAL